MLRLTRTGIGLLSAQYRSVLKKCFLLNLAAVEMALYSAPAFSLDPGYLNGSDVTSLLNTQFGNQINSSTDASNSLHTDAYYAVGLALSGTYDDYRTNPIGDVAWIKNEGTIGIGYTYTSPTSSALSEAALSSGYAAVISNVHRVDSGVIAGSYNGGSVLNNMNHTPLPATAVSSDYAIVIRYTQMSNNTYSYFKDSADTIYGGVLSNVRDNDRMGSTDISNSSFTNNYIMSNENIAGGVIYNGSMETQLEGGSYSFSKAVVNSSNNTYENNGAWNNNLGVSSGTLYDDVVKAWVENYFSADAEQASGGVVYNEGTFNSTNDTFSNNRAQAKTQALGGAIYNTVGEHTYSTAAGGETWKTEGVLNLNGGSFTGNTAASSSEGTASGAGGGAIYNAGTANFSGTQTFSENISNSNAGMSGGGAIANMSGNFTNIGQQTFEENKASSSGGTAYGGAIVNFLGTAQNNGKQIFSENDAGHYGGAIANMSGNFTNNEEQSFTSNTSGIRGGAIYNAVIESSLAGNFYNAGMQEFNNNSSIFDGGAIYNDSLFTNQSSGSQTFTQNSASRDGGAIHNASDFSNAGQQSFTLNRAGEDGGAIYNTSSFTNQSSVSQTFERNSASRYGGAIYNEGTYSGLTGTFEGNQANSTTSGVSGGAIYSAGNGSITNITGTFENNQASSSNYRATGGAVHNGGNSFITVNDVTFTNNSASGTDAYGGAIYNGATISSNSGTALTFNGNKVNATNDYALGGAVYNATGATMTIGDGSTFSGNTASVSSSATEINIAAEGGAIYNVGTLNLSTVEFSNNGTSVTAGNTNGMAVAGGALYNVGTINISSGTQNFTSNSVSSSNAIARGGALYNMAGQEISGLNGTFASNTAESISNNVAGGAISNHGTIRGTMSFNQNSATSENAEARGGAVYNEGFFTTTGDFSANEIKGVTAIGGAIYSANSLTIDSGTGSGFNGNHATGAANADGGAIAIVAATGNTFISGVDFTNNYVTTDWNGRGGAIYNSNSDTLTLLMDVSVSNNYIGINESINQAYTAQGGAIYNNAESGHVSLMNILSQNEDVMIANNMVRVLTAAEASTDLFYGGAIYNGENAYMLISTSSEDHSLAIKLNSANYGGAIYNAASGTNVSVGGIDHSASLTVSALNGDIYIQQNTAYISGGAIYSDVGSDGRTTLIASAATMNITNNKAAESGGAIYNEKDSTVLLQLGDGGKIRLSENQATDGVGGAIHNNGANLNINNTGTVNSAALRFRDNQATRGAAIYNGTNSGTGSAINGTLTNTSVIFSDNTASDGVGGAIYNEINSVINLTMNGTTTVTFQTTKDDVYNDGTIRFTGDSIAPTIPTTSGSITTSAAGDNATHIILNSTFGGGGTYIISNTNLDLGSTGYINYMPMMELRNNVVTMDSSSYINLSALDTLVNNDFNIAENATLNYNAADALTTVTDIDLANTINNSGLINVADNVLTTVNINTLDSDGGTIKIDVHDATASSEQLKADVITINNRIYGTTNVVFDNSDHVVMGINDRIYFATTQGDQSLSEYEFNVQASNSNYLISVGYEANGTVYDWFLYRTGLEAQDVAYIDLPRAAIEQTRSLALQISRTNRGQCNCQTGACDNRTYCRYSSSSPKFRLWATPMYRSGTYNKPVETDIKLKGLEYGLDYQPTYNDLFGIFGSYRDGRYEHSGQDKVYTSEKGETTDIVSKLFGVYYRKYIGDLYMMGALYGGEQEVEIKGDNGVTASTKGLNLGAQAEIGYDIRTTRRSLLTPSVRATYDYIKFDDLTDSADGKAEFGAIHDVELEAALKFEYQFNNEYELPTTAYLKPSVIKTFETGGKVIVKGVDYSDTLENDTLGRVEVGGDAELIENMLSVGAFGNYTFGSAYKAWGVGGNVRLVW